MAKKEKKDPKRAPFWLAILGAILLPLAGIVWWLNVDLLDTDQYVALITPVANNLTVQTSVANYLTDTIFERVDTVPIIQNALPNQNATVAQLLNDALISFTNNQVLTLVQSDVFETIWGSLNRAVHGQVTNLLLGQGQVLALQNGEIAIDLNGLLDQLKTRLTNRGLTNLANQLPEENINYVLFNAPILAKYQPIVNMITALFPWLPILSLGLLGTAIWISKDRIKTIITIGRALLIVAAVMAFLILLTRSQYLNQSFSQYFTKDVAAVFFDAITKPLWLQVLVFTALGIFGVTVRRYLKAK